MKRPRDQTGNALASRDYGHSQPFASVPYPLLCLCLFLSISLAPSLSSFSPCLSPCSALSLSLSISLSLFFSPYLPTSIFLRRIISLCLYVCVSLLCLPVSVRLSVC